MECISLDKIIIPNSVKIISEYCFQNCKELKEIILPKDL